MVKKPSGCLVRGLHLDDARSLYSRVLARLLEAKILVENMTCERTGWVG